MADFMSEESIFKFKNAFAAFESKITGLIKVKQLGGVMRWATTKCDRDIFDKYFRYLGQNTLEFSLKSLKKYSRIFFEIFSGIVEFLKKILLGILDKTPARLNYK